jgi:Uma2 family endonuclease
MVATTSPLTLEEFLEQPETKPASEFIDGEIIQKPMPQGQHSRLQFKLCEVINQKSELQKVAYAFPELRCVVGENAIVPDVAVFRWSRIPTSPTGKIADRFEAPPDWSIEILSPEQSQTKVLANLLRCIQHGTELGWLIDPEVESILVLFPDQRIQLLTGSSILPTLAGIDLPLNVADIFGWLTFL